MRKKFFAPLSIVQFVIVLFLTSFITNPVLAQFAGGSGTEDDPWQISNADQLANMQNYLDGHFIQTSDIDLTIEPLEQTWIPIGDSGEPFTGSFDGGGNIIENMTVYDPDVNYQGLFGKLKGALIRNVILSDIEVDGNQYVGGLAGWADESIIDHVSVSGEIISFDNDAGGVVGYVTESLIHYIFSDVDVQGNNQIGGLIGNARHTEIRHSWSTGHVEGGRGVGGLAGSSWALLLTDCYSHASVSGDSRVGGLVGLLSGRVYRCFSTGNVDGSDHLVGGLIGNTGTTASFGYHSFWDVGKSGQTQSSGGGLVKGLSTSELQQQETFVMFNFHSLWQMEADNGYPAFQDLSVHSQPEAMDLESLQGSGTEEDPYLLSDAGELEAMHEDPEGVYKLADHIDLNGSVAWNYGKGWTPVGLSDDDAAFTGSLDGDGHTITGLTINNPESEYQGLIGYAEGARVEHVKLMAVHVHGDEYSGGLVGYLDEDEDENKGVLETITVSGQITSSYNNIGGVAGYVDESLVHHLSVDVSVFGYQNIGGVIGNARNSEVRHTWSKGRIEAEGIHTARSVGGLIGGSWGLMMTDSYSHASVSADDRVGGLVGGLSGRVYRCFSTGPVSGTEQRVGGLIGSTGTTASFGYHSFWDTESSGRSESAGGDLITGLSTSEMQKQETFAMFNFHSLWQMAEGGYPEFRDFGGYDLPEPVQLTDLAGSGSEESPYIVTSADELNAIRQSLGSNYRLGNDIDMSSSVIWNQGSGWQAIGTSGDDAAFTGSLDGDEYTITGLTINNPESEYQGLFGYAESAWVEDVKLMKVHIHGDEYSGGLVGYLDDDEEENESVLETIRVSGQVTSSYSNIGGVAGYVNESQIHHLLADIAVFGDSNLGGLIGNARDSEVSNSWSTGSIRGASTGTARSAGGLVGSSWGFMMSDSYSHAAVSADDRVGGLVGGLSGEVHRCFSSGLVSGSGSRVGGLIGSTGTTASAGYMSYWNTETSGQEESAGGDGIIGLTTDQMTYPYEYRAYAEWDFGGVWSDDLNFSVNNGYPYLTQNVHTSTDRGDEKDTRDDEWEAELPKEISLSQNYPNPFNPVTMIGYKLPVDREVQLEVFDLLGRRVAVLVNERMTSGTHEVSFDASGLSSGVYISRLIVGGEVHTNTMTLIK